MITIIELNKTTWYGKMILLAFILIFFPAEIFFLNKNKASLQWEFFIPLLFCLFIGVMSVLEFYFIPKGAVLDTDLKQIEVKYFVKANRMIYLDQIDSFYTNSISTRYKQTGTDFDGLLVCLKSGEKVLFSDMYMADRSDINEFLKNAGITDNGTQEFDKIAYYRDSYKANKRAV